MDGIQADIDAHVGAWAKHRKQEPISCLDCTSAGCCRQHPLVGFYDGILIADYLRRNGLDGAPLRRKLREAGKPPKIGSAAKQYRECVFLEARRCSIYEVRPAVCRGHYVTSPPEHCHPASGHSVRVLPVDNSQDIARFATSFAHQLGLKVNAFDILPRVVRRMLYAQDAKTWGDWSRRVNKQPWPEMGSAADAKGASR
jgi:Fe-S-cluster containining protein